jgi:hypothetical protein
MEEEDGRAEGQRLVPGGEAGRGGGREREGATRGFLLDFVQGHWGAMEGVGAGKRRMGADWRGRMEAGGMEDGG